MPTYEHKTIAENHMSHGPSILRHQSLEASEAAGAGFGWLFLLVGRLLLADVLGTACMRARISLCILDTDLPNIPEFAC